MTYADVFTTGGTFIRRVSVEKSHKIFRELETFLNTLYTSHNIRRVTVILTVNDRKSEIVASYTPKGWLINHI